MVSYNRERFRGLFDRDSGRVFANMSFSRCYFERCGCSISRRPSLRTVIRDVTLIACEQRGCAVETAVLDTVTIDGLKTIGLLQCWGAVFKHVVLRGRIGRVMFSSILAPGVDGFAPRNEQLELDEANAAFYETVDWALDLTKDFKRLADGLRALRDHGIAEAD